MIQLSIVICTLKVENLVQLFQSFNIDDSYNDSFEIIIVNQSGKEIITPYPLQFREAVPTPKLSAPQARNYGSSFSNAEYLLFLDDDAFFVNMDNNLFKQLIETLTKTRHSIYIAQRGEIDNDNNYLTHWPSQDEINIRNFPRFIIEWNFIIRKSLFDKIGGFYNIGPGSKHLAQAGEVFILAVKIFSLKLKIHKLDKILIAHPSLSKINKEKQEKYFYGVGYAIGFSIQFMTFFDKIYWILRTIGRSITQPNFFFYKISGLYDGLGHKNPRQSLK